jgi:hypothetical protein
VSEEANVTVASAAEEKCDLAEEKFVVYLEDFEDDFFIPTDRDESIQIEDEASPIATENSNPQTVKPTTSHQPKGYLATATPTTLTSTDTSPAAAVTEDIKLHIYLKDSTRAKIAKNKRSAAHRQTFRAANNGKRHCDDQNQAHDEKN